MYFVMTVYPWAASKCPLVSKVDFSDNATNSFYRPFMDGATMYSTRPGRTATYGCDMKTYRKRTFSGIRFHPCGVSPMFGCIDRYFEGYLEINGDISMERTSVPTC